MSYIHFCALHDEVFQILDDLLIRWEGIYKLQNDASYYYIYDINSMSEHDNIIYIYVRINTNSNYDIILNDVHKGIFAGYVIIIMPHTYKDNSILHLGSLNYSDTRLNPGYPSAKPLYLELKRNLKRICKCELTLENQAYSNYKPIVSDRILKLMREGLKITEDGSEFYSLPEESSKI